MRMRERKGEEGKVSDRQIDINIYMYIEREWERIDIHVDS